MKRHLLITVLLEKIGDADIRSKVFWVLTTPPYPYQGVLERNISVPPSIPGVVVFMPHDIQASPIYVMVTHLHGRKLDVSERLKTCGYETYMFCSPG